MTQIHSSEQNLETATSAKIVPIASHVAPWLTPVLYPLARYIVLPFYFGQIEVIGREHLLTDSPVILAPTHRARWDALMVPYAAGRDVTGRDLRFMVSANEVAGLQGWFIRRMGGFPVDTEQPGIGSFRHGVELLLNKEIIVIFPEGNIFRDNQVHPLKRGLARIALQAESSQPGLGVKIVPISIRYSQSVPSWGCNVNIVIGAPLEVADYDTKFVKRSAKQLTADLETSLINLETGQPSLISSQLSVGSSDQKQHPFLNA
jgi:1-acyl-sn-glycerol-3-phosphate acyltransferase